MFTFYDLKLSDRKDQPLQSPKPVDTIISIMAEYNCRFKGLRFYHKGFDTNPPSVKFDFKSDSVYLPTLHLITQRLQRALPDATFNLTEHLLPKHKSEEKVLLSIECTGVDIDVPQATAVHCKKS